VTDNDNTRAIDEGVVTDFSTRMSYGSYLALDELLELQRPISEPEHHDEMLFIIQHQTSELWMKLLLHEARAARQCLIDDDLGGALKRIARIKHIQEALIQQWSVLATLTPTEYAEFRGFLANSSGFQSHQYRAIEFILGNKHAGMLAVFDSDPAAHAVLDELLHEPDVTKAHVYSPELVPVFVEIYEGAHDADASTWRVYEACEELVDLEDNFQLWRFRHLRTVRRTIGFKRGTGGSAGVDFLQRALDLTFFPELYAVRTEIGQS
jgi:tryptophan 2,3-dioxygenase